MSDLFDAVLEAHGVQVEPTDAPGVARWSGSGQPLGAVIARGVREVLLGSDPPGVVLSQRAGERLAELRTEHPWVRANSMSLVVDERGRVRWWTFAGWRSNLWLARVAADLRRHVAAIDDLTIAIDPAITTKELRAAIARGDQEGIDLAPWVTSEAVDGLKFSECFPRRLALEVVTRRLADATSTAQALGEPVVGWYPSSV
jgi:ATP-dependent Lhr-like helicase